jgi:uncharacterized protein (DUF305 family)
MRRQLWQRLIVAGTGLLAAGMLAACAGGDQGGGPGPGSQSSAPVPADAAFNAADVAFATNMIPHHQQALEMAKLAAARASNSQVKDLADGIAKAQDPEMETMAEWLRKCRHPVPPTTGTDSGHSGMPGMMSDEEMKNLTGATGPDFDRTFLQMMIRHHQGAIEMARTEQADGQNPEAKTLAENIAADQTAEITEMQSLLGKL